MRRYSLRCFASPLLVLLVLTAAAFWPALRSFFYLDDFFLLAISRLLNTPTALFTQDHFPGNVYFRPVGMFFWWLCVELFGNSPRAHYCVNLALHLAIVTCLWRFLLQAIRSQAIAVGATLLFAIHPIAIGTALWLADRFDLLASLFTILTLHMSWQWRSGKGILLLGSAFLLAGLAAFSKEIGFVCFPSALLLLCWPQQDAKLPSQRQIFAAGGLALLGATLFFWRAEVLGGALDSNFLGGQSAFSVILEALPHWLVRFFGFGLLLDRLTLLERGLELVGIVGIATIAVIGALRLKRSLHDLAPIVGAGTLLALATSAAQSPLFRLAGYSATVTLTSQFAVDARLFYLSLLGATICAAGLFASAARSAKMRRLVPIWSTAALACIFPWMYQSHYLANQFRRESLVQKRIVLAAKEAIEKLSLTGSCFVVALNLPANQDFVFTMQFDAAMKALSPNLDRIRKCRFTTDRAPWFFVLGEGSLTPATALPMTPAYIKGHSVPWPAFGGVEISYLNFEGVESSALPRAHFLSFENGAFSDVTQTVLSGQMPVNFRCARRHDQCVP
jgi:hypothetical protein